MRQGLPIPMISGPLLRPLHLDRWLCGHCGRDVLVRRGADLGKSCRWCGEDFYRFDELIAAVSVSLADAIPRAVEAMRHAAEEAGRALASLRAAMRERAT